MLRRLAAFAAALGIATQGVWPLVAQARGAQAVQVTVCSADGAHRSIGLPVGDGKSRTCVEHCQLFVAAGDKLVDSGSRAADSLLFDGRAEDIVERSKASPKSSYPCAACPRAPPASL